MVLSLLRAVLGYDQFLTVAINFMVIAFVLFMATEIATLGLL